MHSQTKIFIALYEFGKCWVRQKGGEEGRELGQETWKEDRKGETQGTEEELAGCHQKVAGEASHSAGLQAVMRMHLL